MELKRVVSLIKTPRHLAKQYLQRRTDPNYRCDFVAGEAKSSAAALAETIQREGIVILPGYFQLPKLGEFRAALERVTKDKTNKYTPDSLWIDDILAAEPVLLEAALDNFLLQIIGDYFQRKFALGIAAATRLFPTPAHRAGSYQWHHDARSKQVNLMILLSNVTAKGQRMSYLRRSHHRYYDHYRGIVDTRFNDDVDADPQSRDRIVEVVGAPGTIALFDSNGLHSGNRNDIEPRDTLNINYVSHRRHTKKVRVRRRDLSALPPAKREVLTSNPKLELLD
jgi:hypothetical protein